MSARVFGTRLAFESVDSGKQIVLPVWVAGIEQQAEEGGILSHVFLLPHYGARTSHLFFSCTLEELNDNGTICTTKVC